MQRARAYGLALIIMLLASVSLALLRNQLTLYHAAHLLTLVTLIVAVTLGLGPALLAAVIAFLGLNYLMVTPLYTFTVDNPAELIDLLFFLLVASIGGQLAGYARQKAQQARRYADEQRALYHLSSLLNQQMTRAAVLATLQQHVPVQLPVRGVTLLPDNVNTEDNAVEPTLYLLLRTVNRVFGTLRVDLVYPLETAQRQLLVACAAQASIALERIALTEEARHTTTLAEADKLKTALLRTVSHDLRTPITIIRSTAEHVRRLDADLAAGERQELIANIEQQADRLNRLVGDLLDFSRLEAGVVTLKHEWNAVEEVVSDVAAEMWQLHGQARVTLNIPPDLPLIHFDYTLLRQALFNIVENAVRHEPADRQVQIEAGFADDHVFLHVINHGQTIELTQKQMIMEPFYHARTGGIGLGLAIAKSVIDLHQGSLQVDDTAGGGATFRITLPRQGQPNVDSGC